MKSLLRWLSRSRYPYEPLIKVEISRSRLLSNLERFQNIAPNGIIAPVLKSNAYGHGLLDVARILERYRRGLPSPGRDVVHPIPFFVVDSFFEALALRNQGIRAPLLVIGYTRPETIMASSLRDVSFMVGSLDSLQAIESIEHPVRIHLKIDTGMRRQGILPQEIDAALGSLENNENLALEGLCTHFSDADDPDGAFTEGQIRVWNKAVTRFKNGFRRLKYFHASNTDGHRYSSEIDANVSRLGIGLYGLVDGSAFSPALDLKPVLSMKTVVSAVKKISRGDSVGYGRTFKADRDMTIATVPAGYYEGIDRRLSNNGSLLIGPDSEPCPIIGRVSMNITTVDASHAYKAAQGEEATLISDEPSDLNSVMNIAKACGTIPYEIAVHIPAHLKRVVMD
ncbi:MAG: alanine racemase [Patescibacteria group bacterium]|nr:alanine racemase [Patescibacteria group bacterium]